MCLGKKNEILHLQICYTNFPFRMTVWKSNISSEDENLQNTTTKTQKIQQDFLLLTLGFGVSPSVLRV